MKRLDKLCKKTLIKSLKPIDINLYPLKTIYYQGNKIYKFSDVKLENIHTGELGVTEATLEGYTCPRCNNNKGFIVLDNKASMYFCSEYKCLQDDGKYYRTTVRFKHLDTLQNESF